MKPMIGVDNPMKRLKKQAVLPKETVEQEIQTLVIYGQQLLKAVDSYRSSIEQAQRIYRVSPSFQTNAEVLIAALREVEVYLNNNVVLPIGTINTGALYNELVQNSNAYLAERGEIPPVAEPLTNSES